MSASLESIMREFGYTLHEQVGKGGFATVHRCTRDETGEEFAVKAIDLRPKMLDPDFDKDRLLREVRVMQRLQHSNIVRLQEVFDFDARLLFVMEYFKGRELFDAILDRGKFTEDAARPIFAQLLSAVRYLHELSVVHRDIKPENILIMEDADGPAPRIKLIDFGLSKMVGGKEQAVTFVGTPQYFAPEVDPNHRESASAPYGVSADCWSLGAVLYVMLAGRFPAFRVFHEPAGGGAGGGGQAAKRREVAFPENIWADSTGNARALIAGLMEDDPKKRLTAQQAAEHPWVKGAFPIALSIRPPQPPTASQQQQQQQQDVTPDAVVGAGSGSGSGSGSTAPPPPTKLPDKTRVSGKRPRRRSGDEADGSEGATGEGALSPVSAAAAATAHLSVTDAPMSPVDSLPAAAAPAAPAAAAGGDGDGGGSGGVGVGVGVSTLDVLPTIEGSAGRGKVARLHTQSDAGSANVADKMHVVCCSTVANTDYSQLHKLNTNITALLEAQKKLAAKLRCIHSHAKKHEVGSLLAAIQDHSNNCRHELRSSQAVLSQLGAAADHIMETLPDLRLAIEVGEPALAHDFFDMSRKRVKEVKDEAVAMCERYALLRQRLQKWMEGVRTCNQIRTAYIDDKLAAGEPVKDMERFVMEEVPDTVVSSTRTTAGGPSVSSAAVAAAPVPVDAAAAAAAAATTAVDATIATAVEKEGVSEAQMAKVASEMSKAHICKAPMPFRACLISEFMRRISRKMSRTITDATKKAILAGGIPDAGLMGGGGRGGLFPSLPNAAGAGSGGGSSLSSSSFASSVTSVAEEKPAEVDMEDATAGGAGGAGGSGNAVVVEDYFAAQPSQTRKKARSDGNDDGGDDGYDGEGKNALVQGEGSVRDLVTSVKACDAEGQKLSEQQLLDLAFPKDCCPALREIVSSGKLPTTATAAGAAAAEAVGIALGAADADADGGDAAEGDGGGGDADMAVPAPHLPGGKIVPCAGMTRGLKAEYSLKMMARAVSSDDWNSIMSKLQHMDRSMQQFAQFWANMDVLVNTMFQRSDHVEVRRAVVVVGGGGVEWEVWHLKWPTCSAYFPRALAPCCCSGSTPHMVPFCVHANQKCLAFLCCRSRSRSPLLPRPWSITGSGQLHAQCQVAAAVLRAHGRVPVPLVGDRLHVPQVCPRRRGAGARNFQLS